MDYFLGVDGGGSNTRFVLTDAKGGPLLVKHFGPSNIQEVEAGELATTFNAALSEMASFVNGGAVKSAFFGIAGITSESDKQFMLNLVGSHPLLKKGKVEADHDVRIALAGGLTGRPGIALIAGTGSSCYGRNERNISHRCGGWGSLADDIGSGGWIGVRALQIAVRQADGREPETQLLGLVKEFLQLKSMDDFLNRVHRQGLSRPHRALLAPLVIQSANEGDGAAKSIIEEAVAGLSELVFTCGCKLKMISPEVVFVGGLTKAPYFSTLLESALKQRHQNVSLSEPELTPAAGSVLIALKNEGITADPPILHNLKQID